MNSTFSSNFHYRTGTCQPRGMASQSLSQGQLLKLTAVWELTGSFIRNLDYPEVKFKKKKKTNLTAYSYDGKTEPSSHGIFNPPVSGCEHTWVCGECAGNTKNNSPGMAAVQTSRFLDPDFTVQFTASRQGEHKETLHSSNSWFHSVFPSWLC